MKLGDLGNVVFRLWVVVVAMVVMSQIGVVSASTTTYYVSPSGSDSNPGIKDKPFKTFAKAEGMLRPGDTLRLLPGVYSETLRVRYAQSTADQPITITSDSARAVIDMQNASERGIIVATPHVNISNIEVRNSHDICVLISEDDVHLDNMLVHHCDSHGVVLEANNLSIRNSTVHHAVLENQSRATNGGWGSAIKIRGEHVEVIDNRVYKNYGEGIGVRSRHVLVEGNTVYDNYSVNIYVDNTFDIKINGNFVYCTGDREFFRDGECATGVGISEEYFAGWGSNLGEVTITNNVVAFGSGNLSYFGHETGITEPGVKGGVIAHNVFWGSAGKTIYFVDEPYTRNVIFANNIVYNADGLHADFNGTNGLTVVNNFWAGNPTLLNNAQSAGDLTGNVGFATTPSLDPNSFRLGSKSRAINAGYNAGIAVDYYGKARDSQPDMGMHEYDGVAPPPPSPSPSPSPTATHTPTATPTATAAPPPAPTLVAPVDGLLTSDRTPTFDWTDVPGVVRYNIMVDDDPAFGSPRVNVNRTASTYTPNLTPLADGMWYWKVRTLGAAGNWGNWSSVWDMTIDTTRPGRPTATAPANAGTINTRTPIFRWTNPGDAASYHIQMDINSFFRSANKIDGYSNSTRWTSAPLTDGKWFWRVQAIDAAGNVGAWSVVSNIFIDAVVTPVPTVVSPANRLLTKDAVHAFDWTDEVGVKRYNIQVDNEPTFAAPYRINANPVASEFRNGALPLGSGTWYWRVRAQGTDNIWGEYSGYRTLVIDIVRPDRPTPTSPAANAVVNDATPLFQWTAVGDAASYILQIDKNVFFASPDRVTYPGIGTNQHAIPAGLYDGAWFWRVAAVDAAGNQSAWSANSKVFVDAVVMTVPTPVSPTNGLLTKDAVHTFDWTDKTGVKRYNIQVNSAVDFTGAMRVNANPVASEFRNGARPLGSGTWYWRVRAQGTDNIWGAWSMVWSINVDRIKPTRPTLLSPANNTTTSDNTPTFEWNAVADADVVGYILQIDKNYFFASPERIQHEVAGTSYTPGELVDRRWFWRVAAVDAVGNQSAWSAFWSVIVNTTASPSAQVIESDSPQVQREGQWQRYTLSGGSYLASSGASAAISLTFTGSQIEVVYAKHSTLGTFAIKVDGQVVQTINSRTPNAMALARVTIPVTPGEHTVRVVSMKGTVVIDAFVITP